MIAQTLGLTTTEVRTRWALNSHNELALQWVWRTPLVSRQDNIVVKYI